MYQNFSTYIIFQSIKIIFHYKNASRTFFLTTYVLSIYYRISDVGLCVACGLSMGMSCLVAVMIGWVALCFGRCLSRMAYWRFIPSPNLSPFPLVVEDVLVCFALFNTSSAIAVLVFFSICIVWIVLLKTFQS